MQYLCTHYRIGESTSKKTGELKPSYTLCLHPIQQRDGKPFLMNKPPIETWQTEPISGGDEKYSGMLPFIADADIYVEHFGQHVQQTVLSISNVRQLKLP